MADETEVEKKRRVGRSPAYPFIPVQKAIEQTRALYEQEGEYYAPLPSAFSAWGYGPKSSGARQTLATLKYYGLIDVQGDGDSRKVKASEIARRIILDQREDETDKRRLIREVAMMPSAHKTLYKAYPSGLPSDSNVTHFLIFDQNYNKEAARDLLAEYKDTASYAGIYQPQKEVDKTPEEEENPRTPPEVKVGDRIQATVNGQDMFPNGAKVLGFTEDGAWAFTDQSKSAVKIEEITVLESAPITPAAERPMIPASLLAGNAEEKEPVGTRKAVFPVSEGDVALVFPKDLSAEGLRELGLYLDIFLKKEEAAAKKQ